MSEYLQNFVIDNHIDFLIEKCLLKLVDYSYVLYSSLYCDYNKYDYEVLEILKEIKLNTKKKLNLHKITNYICKYDFVNSLEYLIHEFEISLDCLILSDQKYSMFISSCSPLHICIENDSKRCFDLLINKGSSVFIYKVCKNNYNNQYKTLLEIACELKNIYFIEKLILSGCELVTGKNKNIILFCLENNLVKEEKILNIIEKRKLLIKNQISINIKNIPDDLINEIINKLY